MNIIKLQSVLILILFIANLSSEFNFLFALPSKFGYYPRNNPTACVDNAFGGYLSCGFPLLINITNPPTLVGGIGYLPTDNTAPQMKNWHLDSNGNYNVRLLIPNKNESDNGYADNPSNIAGCPYPDGDIFKYNYFDDGTPFAGNAILTTWTSCVFNGGPAGYGALGASLVITSYPPYSEPAGHPTDLYGPLELATLEMPWITIDYQDWSNLLQFIRDNPTVEVNISIAGPSHMEPNQKEALLGLLDGMDIQSYDSTGYPALPSSVYFYDDPSFRSKDPCWDGLYGMWCERGKLVSIQWGNWGIRLASGQTAMNDTAFTYLATHGLVYFFYFPLGSYNLRGPFPPSLCVHPERVTLVTLIISADFTSLPNCFDKMKIAVLDWQAGGGQLGAFPSTLANSSTIVTINFPGGTMKGGLPSSFANAVNLGWFDVSNNFLSGPFPTFKGLQNLTTFDASGNSFTSMSIDAFDSCTKLQSVKIGSNQISSPYLPSLIGSQRDLFAIDFSFNKFSGSIPMSWSQSMLKQLTQLSLASNLLDSSNIAVMRFTTLTDIDLSKNLFIITAPASDYVQWINNILPPTAVKVSFAHNQLTGTPAVLGFTNPTASSGAYSITSLDVSYNNITGLPPDLYAADKVVSWNFAGNPINQVIPSGSPANYQTFFDFTNCPGLVNTIPGTLPTFLTFKTTDLSKTPSSNFLCYSVTSNIQTNPNLIFRLDPSFYSYGGCFCDLGTYGKPPACLSIPTTLDSTSGATPVLKPFVPLSSVVTNGPTHFNQFSDGWYGDQRALNGLDTLWVIDLSDSFVKSFVDSSLSSYSNSSSGASFLPVRSVTLRFFFDLLVFNSSSDIIDVFLDSSLTKEFLSIVGSASQSLPILTNASIMALDPTISTLVESYSLPSMMEVDVPSPTVSIEFRSRSKSGVHFNAQYFGSSKCPDGYDLDGGSCVVQLKEFKVSTALLAVMHALSAFVGLCVIVCALIIVANRNQMVVKAASTKFTILTLICLLWLAGSSSLYAIVPSNLNNSICYARLWCSCLALMGVLGILVAKSFRVSVIFGSKVLMQIRSVTDSYLAGILCVLWLIQIVMLIIFNSLQMTSADFISNGDGTASYGCRVSNGFNAWMGVQIAIFACVMIAGAVVAFRTRSVPSAFNESTHILFCLQILIFMLVILAPLDWALVNNSPSASVVIQAGGQLLLTFFILMSNMIPKIFFILTGKGDDKSLAFSTGSRSQSAARSSSQGDFSASNQDSQTSKTSQTSEMQTLSSSKGETHNSI